MNLDECDLYRLGRPDMAHAVKDWNPDRHD